MARIHFLLDDRLGLLAGCGGTLISRSVVLTAGHCVVLARPGAKNVFVRIGAYNPLTDEATKHAYVQRRVARIITHPGYVQMSEDQPTSPHDIALIKLDEPVPENVTLVGLPAEDTPYPIEGTQLHAVGWGSTDSGNSQPAYAMQDVELPAVSVERCRVQWGYAGAAPTLITGGHVCAGLQAQRNICFGDSGGPLLRTGSTTSKDVQLGITSFSFPTCALPGMPGVFTFVPQYRKWIDEQLAVLEGRQQAPSQAAPSPAAAPAAGQPRVGTAAVVPSASVAAPAGQPVAAAVAPAAVAPAAAAPAAAAVVPAAAAPASQPEPLVAEGPQPDDAPAPL
ncbi:transmembrane protease serine 9-like [Micractinium conductrix]|uniref:Transmembrane protease serine 9-like n=1 Tax=Micractinium conductrix TaxID=554055 RepID=A0A2P6V4A1_9CHLO|nr:transmembrane protease serine 9-like [Micractinium conductrix]|eukprot:PSC68899.1 transmembrane protease serine 9-like [Micractinium conductrix]